MIKAIIERESVGIAVTELKDLESINKALYSLGIKQRAQELKLTDEDGDNVRIKLYSDSEFGNRLILLLKESDTLYDAFVLEYTIAHTSEEVLSELEQDVLYEQYDTMNELMEDIKDRAEELGEEPISFFCPLEEENGEVKSEPVQKM